MYNTDAPIKSENDDLLNRKKFVKQLAEAIMKNDFKESLVIGLYGEWGSGKSSILNLVHEYIKNNNINKEKEIKELHFNPWNFSEQNILLLEFFNCLDEAFEDTKKEKKLKNIVSKIYNKILEKIFKKQNKKIHAQLKLNEYADRILSSNFNIKLLNVSAENNIFKRSKSNESLNKLKKEFSKALKEANLNILIIIDDIDRCNNLEIKQIFQLVKSIGDFPGIMYILSFDKNIVLKSLKKGNVISSDKYLEKIVQISFEVPTVRSNEIGNILKCEIFEILNENNVKFNNNDWYSISNFFKPYFSNIRDINRYCNSLRFQLPIIKDDIFINDFLLITLINLFEPNLYAEIYDNKTLFTQDYGMLEYAAKTFFKNDREILEKIIEREYKLSKENVERLVLYLFPELKYILNDERAPLQYKDCMKYSKICSKISFDNYFTLNISNNDISNTQIKKIVEYSNDEDIFKSNINRLNEDFLVPIFLEKFNDYYLEIPQENIPTIIKTLMDNSDYFWEENPLLLHNNNDEKLCVIYINLLSRIQSQNDRFEIIKESINNAKNSVYSFISFINYLNLECMKFNKEDSSKNQEDLIINFQQINVLKEIASNKINSKPIESVLSNKYLHFILIEWANWGKKEDLTIFFNKLNNTYHLLNFIIAFIDSNYFNDLIDIYLNPNQAHYNFKMMEKYMEIPIILNQIKNIPKEEYENYNSEID